MIDAATAHTQTSPEPAPPAVSPGSVVLPWVGWRVSHRVAAIGASLLLHALLALIALLLVLQRPMAGQAGQGDEIQLAVITERELADLQDALPSDAPPDLPDAGGIELFELAEIPAPEALRSSSATTDAAISGVGDSLSDGGGVELGALGTGGTSFFGVEAVGSRFAYIVDISGSMQGTRIESLKQQLTSSIDALQEHGAYCIVLFSSDSRPLGGRVAWTPATEERKAATRMEIRGISPTGGTVPLPAFEMVFTLDPRPDAIYFMTDGEFQNENAVVGRITQLNGFGRRRVPIHTITFGSNVGERVMRRIAEVSGGKYVFVSERGP